MKIKTDFQQYRLKRRMNSNQPHFINRYENHNFIISNLSNHIQKLEINENIKNNKEKKRNFNYSFLIPEQILRSLLTTMNQNTKLSLNSLNLVNFIYQTYNTGINIIQEKNNRNKSTNVENCLNQRKFITNYNPNFSVYSTVIGEGGNNNIIFDNFKNSNEDIINFNESYNKENCSNFISPNNIFFKKNVSMKNIDSNYNHIINKEKQKNKYKSISTKDIKYILKRRNSSIIQNNEKSSNKFKKLRYRLLTNKYNDSNNDINFALLPMKDIFTKLKKFEKIPPSISNKNIKSSHIKKNKNMNGTDNPQTIKLFTEKYEKEKENFNNILFDECIELRKKKFKLESFIKRFANKHFVEKLYKAKEYSLKKCNN